MKQIIFIMLLTAILLLSGCEQTTDTNKDIAVSFIGGTDALDIKFVESAPPNEVLDGRRFPFDINLELTNKGESEVKASDIRLEIAGVNPADFGKLNSDLVKTSIGMDLYANRKTSEGQIITGGMTYANFAGFNYQNTLNGNVNFPIVATACYKYSTKAVAKMCVRKNLLKATVEQGNGCAVKGEKVVQNSGSPVEINSLQQFPTGEKRLSFTFIVEKKGTGNIFKSVPNVAPTCSDDMTLKDKVFITVDTGLVGTGVALTCDSFEDLNGNPSNTNSGYVTLYSGKRTVTCAQTLAETLDFEKVIDFTVDFTYQHSITKNIVVKQMG